MANVSRRNTLLRNMRVEHGFTQSKLAELVGVEPKTMQRWESGSSTPRPYALRCLCMHLHATPEALGFSDTQEREAVEQSVVQTLTSAKANQVSNEKGRSCCLFLVLFGCLLTVPFIAGTLYVVQPFSPIYGGELSRNIHIK